MKSLSRVRLFAAQICDPDLRQIIAYQDPPSMGFSRQEYWSRVPFPSPGDLPDPEIEPGSPALQADVLPSRFLKERTFNTYCTGQNNIVLRLGIILQIKSEFLD